MSKSLSIHLYATTTAGHLQGKRDPSEVRVTKPVDFAKFQQIIKDLANYWFTVVVLPPGT